MSANRQTRKPLAVEDQVQALISAMTLGEKIGQMCQLNVGTADIPVDIVDRLRSGTLGSVLNTVNLETVNEIQRIAVEESRLGIPLLIGRDVIHGFKTILPIPLGQAATWNPDLVRDGARLAAREAKRCGVNWTFAPMIDIARDPRWGRVAESLGEDPLLSAELGIAMIEGFQGQDLADTGSIAACAKHFVGYGACEAGRDYSTTNVSENELRNTHLRPFHAAVDAGVATLMTSFSDIDGVPATGNAFLVNDVLRGEWNFDGFVVSDWDSVRQLSVHGLTGSAREAAFEAASAGVDMEMFGDAYYEHLASLISSGEVSIDVVDRAVANILRAKARLGLFEQPYIDAAALPEPADTEALDIAKQSALQSVVLLKNDVNTLPLHQKSISSLAVIGPLANAPQEQLGTWIFDGDPSLSVTPLEAIRGLVGSGVAVNHLQALETSRSRDCSEFEAATQLASASDATVLFLGEEAILSGEAHSRADISLPGAQAELVRAVRAAGSPVIAVILAGRPLTLGNIIDEVDAILYAWHPGTMGGPAIADLLFGHASPSGKLPISFPRMVGQVPIYYNQKNTGRPPTPESVIHIDDIEAGAPQDSLGMTAFHLDAGYTPQYAFGHGLSYTTFEYADLRLSRAVITADQTIEVSVALRNTGPVAADEVVQVYLRDLVGNVTRPVRELKAFKRVHLRPSESTRVVFDLGAEDFAFYGRDQALRIEPGDFHVWVGGSSEAELRADFRIVNKPGLAS